MLTEQIELEIKNLELEVNDALLNYEKYEGKKRNLLNKLFELKVKYYKNHFKYEIGDFVKVTGKYFQKFEDLIFEISNRNIISYNSYMWNPTPDKHVLIYNLSLIDGIYDNKSDVTFTDEFEFGENFLIKVSQNDVDLLKRKSLEEEIKITNDRLLFLQNKLDLLDKNESNNK